MRAQFVIPVLASVLILGGLGLSQVFALTYTEDQILVASGDAAGEKFGTNLSISGDTAIVGAPNFIGAESAAYIFVRSGATWVEQTKLSVSDPTTPFDGFGNSVAISGDTVIVSDPASSPLGITFAGAAYVFERDAGGANNWGLVAKLTASDAAANDRFGEGSFGNAVSISGDTLIIGTLSNDDACPSFSNCNSGSAYVFVKPAGGWADSTETVKLTPFDGTFGDLFGNSVSISGDTAIVGAFHHDGPGPFLIISGAAYVYERDVGGANNWGLVAQLTASDRAAEDSFGRSVSISDDTIIVGVSNDDDGGTDSGSAYVFEKIGTTWTQQAKLTASDASAHDLFGNSISISGDTAIVGARFNDDACPSILTCDSGSAYVFVKPAGGWTASTETVKLIASDAAGAVGLAGDLFGSSVSISGNTAIVGAVNFNAGTIDDYAAYVFELDFPPPIPDLISPADSSFIADQQPDLTWSEVIDPEGSAVSYVPRLVNTANPTIEIELVELSLVSAEPITVLPEGNYEWQVKSIDEFGNTFGFSTPFTFTLVTDVITSDPGGNVNVSPGDTLVVTGGVTVSGNIVNDGGTVIIQAGSTINGNIKTKNGGTVTIDASNVNGNVDGKDAIVSITGGSTISGDVNSNGSTSVVITGSTIRGDINVKNAQNVSITRNTVNGNLNVKDSNSVSVFGNTISGNLKITGTIDSCFGNDTNNTVSGSSRTPGCTGGQPCPPNCPLSFREEISQPHTLQYV